MNKKDLKIVLLSAFNDQNLPYFLKKLYSGGFRVGAIILDGVISDRIKSIEYERTKNFYQWPDFFDIEEFEIPVFLVKNHNGAKSEKLLRKINPEIIINAGTPRILKENIISIPSRGIVNCHPGILPEYRGCTCVEWSIYNDDEVGSTCHFMDAGIDSGAIIYSEVMPIRKGDVYEKVRTDVLFHGVKVLIKGLKKIINGNLNSRSLPKQIGGNYYKVIPEDKLEEVKRKLINCQYKHYVE